MKTNRKLILLSATATTLALYSGGKSHQATHFDAMAANLLRIRQKTRGPRTPQIP